MTDDNKDFVHLVAKENYLSPKESLLKEPPWERGKFEPNSQRTGVIARKIGIYPMWTKSGKKLLTTLLQIVDNHVIRYHPPEVYAKMRFGDKHGQKGRLGCLVVGAESTDPQKFSAEYIGLFTEAGVMPKRKLTRFFITPNAALQPGTPLNASHFRVGDYVDVFGKTIGHGFQGVVKRWGFKGGPASHGSTKFHRKPGYIGGGSKRGVMRGKKLPGHMGQERRILRGLKIWRINTKHNVIWVQGPAVPGWVHAYVYIFDSTLNYHQQTEDDHAPFPTYFPDDDKEQLPEELYDPELHVFSDPTITFEEAETNKN